MAALLEKILPLHIDEHISIANIQEAVEFYSEDLNSDLIDEEYSRWKSKWLKVPKENHPRTLSEALNKCCLSNVHTLLKFFATIPLSSCWCERSASASCRLKTIYDAHKQRKD